MTLREVHLDEAEHRYTLNGVRAIGVTDILRGMLRFGGARQEDIDAACARGSAADRAVEILATGNELEPESVHPVISPYIAAFEAFQRDTRFHCLDAQRIVSHLAYRYCGKLDLRGFFPHSACARDVGDVIDVKCTAAVPLTVGIQTAGYAGAIAEETGAPFSSIGRYCLWLKRDGTYRLKPCRSGNDWHVFCSALTLVRWCDAVGINL
jgi:hypothetical protein